MIGIDGNSLLLNFLLCGIDRSVSKCEDGHKLVRDMFAINRAAAPNSARDEISPRSNSVRARIRRDGERGAALVEFALVVPILMTFVLGMFSFGILLNQYLELTNATALGGQYLSVLRGPSATDPCAQTISAIESAAPLLNPASMNFSFSITYLNQSTGATTVYPYVNKTTCTAGVNELSQGEPITVTVTYPCTLYVFGNANFLPGCTLTSQITEDSQ
jgi:Flp pilus assembly protein TadG